MSTIKGDEEDRPFTANGAESAGVAVSNQETDLLRARPGWQTSQGLLTALVVVGAFAYLFFGPSIAADRLNSAVSGALALAERLTPVIAAVVALRTYTNSRGKIQSNELWANAAISSPLAMLLKGPASNTETTPLLAQGLLGRLGASIDRGEHNPYLPPARAQAVIDRIKADGGPDWSDMPAYVNAVVARLKRLEDAVTDALHLGAVPPVRFVTSADHETMMRAVLGRLEHLEAGGEVVSDFLDDLALIVLHTALKLGTLPAEQFGPNPAQPLKLRDAIRRAAHDGLSAFGGK
jgi:hypothetical protein